MVEMWRRLDVRARAGLIIGSALVVLLVGALAVWAYRPDYQVLFADMAPRDAAAMAGELEKMKTPYQLADNGNTIMVPRDLVYKTRLKLMGKDVPLHGAVGFEVFNNADFGMTDFVQKVNYQRAIQGELTRTILAIDEVQSARVHLALPEQGLFKKSATKPKASVTVTMKPGRVLEPVQVTGIQRLVAASVTDIAAADVTILDQHGVALTRPAGADATVDGLSQLDGKRSAEDYINKKVGQVLDQTFGAGEAMASVDLVLNLDQTKVTTDEVLPGWKPKDDVAPTGVVVREHHTVREGDPTASAATVGVKSGDDTTAEAEYQVGRRVEQVSVTPGSIKRMTIAVVVKRALSEAQRAQLREVVALAAGFTPARGDAIVVSSIDSMVSGQPAPAAPVAPDGTPAPVTAGAATAATPPVKVASAAWWSALALTVVVVGAALGLRRRTRGSSVRARLSEAQRLRLAADVQQWIQAPVAVAEREE